MSDEKLFSKIKDNLKILSSNFASQIITSFFWFYLATIALKEEYGEIGYLISIATLGFTISALGLGRTIIVYESKKENIFTPAYSLSLFSTSVVSFIVLLITENIFVSILIWGQVLFWLMTTSLISKQNYQRYSIFRFLRSISVLAFSIPLYFVFGTDGVIIGFMFSTFFGIIGLIKYLKNKKESIRILKSKFWFILNNFFTNLAAKNLWSLDRIVIGSIFGFSLLAEFQLASQYILLLHTLPTSLVVYLLPKESTNKKNKQIKLLSVTISMILAMMSLFLIPFGIHSFFSQYSNSIEAAQIMSFAIIPITVYMIKETELLGQGRSRPVLISSVTQIITYLSLISVLGNEFGLTGMAFALLISCIIRMIISFIIEKLKV